MALPTVTTGNLAQLLDQLVARVPEAEHAVALSPDGLLLAATTGVDEELAEQLSSVVAGLRALAVAAGEHSGSGGVRQIIVEMGNGFLFIAATSGGAILAVLFAADSEVASIAYEVALFAGRLDLHLPPFGDPSRPPVTAG
ncbi:Predicted regulator of Ras-like GTPase activity, Roadblock/LC7/MglB family [Micromonospora pattaloongensis]|uniref:Predicted regulator of Ras-like GTPase activity, Roadblock/LC7/MglB family n=1 Tax=Micromonospora pattaloongensis TaxID=405436 RepID=A0A1H3SUL8_9ACTN|nr:roadblock/LC7 domain-containing protein [Micromonospora pattaloongensis]SDZ41672.1 Predicted regulator of Ras-like GTPase activity, Roadblock/LC7/MglB family [Micromonospora pattaloongensis]